MKDRREGEHWEKGMVGHLTSMDGMNIVSLRPVGISSSTALGGGGGGGGGGRRNERERHWMEGGREEEGMSKPRSYTFSTHSHVRVAHPPLYPCKFNTIKDRKPNYINQESRKVGILFSCCTVYSITKASTECFCQPICF